jgi:hypothetical protein
MLMPHATVPSVKPGFCWDQKLSGKGASILHSKLGCSAVYNSVEGHHVQKPHLVHSYKFNFTRVSHHLCKSLNERTSRHWLVFLVLHLMLSITVFPS